MIKKLLKIFLYLLPLLEIATFIIIGSWLGVIPTLLLIVATSMLGIAILRMEGFVTLLGIQRRFKEGHYPTLNVFDTALMLLGAFLLVIPGFITDLIGCLLLFSKIRSLFLSWLVKKKILTAGPSEKNNVIIEGEFHYVKDNHDQNSHN